MLVLFSWHFIFESTYFTGGKEMAQIYKKNSLRNICKVEMIRNSRERAGPETVDVFCDYTANLRQTLEIALKVMYPLKSYESLIPSSLLGVTFHIKYQNVTAY